MQHSACSDAELLEPVIGLEIHAQLLTATKIFCGCSTRFGAAPNTARVSRVPRPARRAAGAERARRRVRRPRRARARLRRSSRVSVFARKNYFYPDLPKGYQISQYERPLATDGALEYDGGARPRAGSASPRPHRGGRREVAARRLRRFGPAHLSRFQPQRRAAHRDRDPARPALGRRRGASSSAGSARSSSPSASTTATWRRAASAATRTSRCGPRARRRSASRRRSRTSTRSVTCSGRSSTRSSGRSACSRRRPDDRAGDATLGHGGRPDGLDAQQGRSARLPILSGAGPAAARARRRPGSRSIREHAARAARRTARAVSSTQYALPDYDAALLTQSAELADYFEATAAACGQREGGEQLDHGRADPEDERARRSAIDDVPHDARRAGGLDSARRLGHD